MTQEPDYICINPSALPGKFNVVVMRCERDEWGPFKVSQALSLNAASALALSWAEALSLEIRGSIQA